jgi:TfoX/Sxy family transcriptional regulator of competence genes
VGISGPVAGFNPPPSTGRQRAYHAGMAFDEELAERVRLLLDHHDVVEKRMFGGLAFLVHGNMCAGVHGVELIARVGAERVDRLLGEPGARVFDLAKRPIRGWLLVDPSGTGSDEALTAWVDHCLDHVLALPRK